MKISMIGPVPVHLGGGRKWRGGGVSSHIQGLLSALSSQAIDVHLLADNVADKELPANELPPHIQILPINRSFWQLARLNPVLLVQLAKRFSKREIRSSIPWLQLVRFVGLALNYRHFTTNIPADILHVQHILHRPYICKRVLQVDLPFIVTVQSVNFLMEMDTPWHAKMAYGNYPTVDRLIAVSRYVKDMMVQHGAEEKRIVVIPNGVDTNKFTPAPLETARKHLGLSLEKFIILFTGNLVPRKGVDVLLKAFRSCADKHPNTHLIILGEGEERESLSNLARELGITRQVQFPGFRTLPEMPLWYQACNLFVMPSWAEGLSLSLLEAMGTAKPVITSYPTVGKHDAIEPGETGWLTQYGDVSELAKVITESVERPELTQNMGRKARHIAEAHFSWQAIGERTMTVYREVLAERKHDGRLHPL